MLIMGIPLIISFLCGSFNNDICVDSFSFASHLYFGRIYFLYLYAKRNRKRQTSGRKQKAKIKEKSLLLVYSI